MLYPEINIDSSTVVRGKIDSDLQEFKFRFRSKRLLFAKNTFDNIRINVDNKNPLYNAYVELDSIKTPYYKIRDFNLINVTSKDTLLFVLNLKEEIKEKIISIWICIIQ